MTRIWVEDMRFFACHGLLPEEARAPQLFSVDVDIWLDSDRAGATGALAATVDYRTVWKTAHDVMTGPREELLERLCWRIAEGLDRRPAARIRVRVRKLAPPLLGPAAEVGAEVVRE